MTRLTIQNCYGLWGLTWGSAIAIYFTGQTIACPSRHWVTRYFELALAYGFVFWAGVGCVLLVLTLLGVNLG